MEEANLSKFECLEVNFGPQRDPLYIVIPIITVYVLIFITGVVGNVSTCIVISSNKSMHTATNYYLFSLAVSDLLLLVSGLPQEIYLIWSRYPYIFGAAFCFLRGLFAEISSNATVCTITAFTVERYLAICHPLKSHMMSNLSRAVRIIITIWIFSVCLAIPQAMQFGIVVHGDCEICQLIEPIIDHSFEVSSLVFFIAPMTVITVLYILIGVKLHQSKVMRRQHVSIDRQRRSSRKIIKMLVAVVVAFFICWAPFHIQRLFTIYSGNIQNKETYHMYLKIYEVVTYISGILYYLSATINPILYNIMSVKFREAFRETFSKCCSLSCIKSRKPQRSYSVLSRSVPTGCDQTSRSASSSGGRHSSVTEESTFKVNIALSRNDTPKIVPDQKPDKMQKRLKQTADRLVPNECLDIVKDQSDSKLQQTYDMIVLHVRSIDKISKDQSNVSECCGFFTTKDRERLNLNRKYSAHYSAAFLDQEVFKNSRNEDDVCTISNSSLKDMERDTLEDELTTYMKEIMRREKNVAGVQI